MLTHITTIGLSRLKKGIEMEENIPVVQRALTTLRCYTFEEVNTAFFEQQEIAGFRILAISVAHPDENERFSETLLKSIILWHVETDSEVTLDRNGQFSIDMPNKRL